MRHILTSVVLLALLFPAVALGEEVTMDDLVERDGLYYKKFTDVPFTGKVSGKDRSPLFEIHGSIKDEKKEGPWISYWRNNGHLSEKGS